MPAKRPAKGSAKEGQGSQQARSDDEILKKRQRVEAFDAADKYLKYLGTSLWGVAAAWFLCCSDAAPDVPSLHRGAGNAELGLITAGYLCSGLSRASPRGAWSAWRKPWHLAWCPSLALLAASLGLAASSGGAAVLLGAAACGLLALAAFATCPAGPPPSGAASAGGAAVSSARLLAAVDGLLGLSLALSLVLGGPWAERLGPAAIALTAVPAGMTSLGLLLCCTEAELLAAVPCAMLFCLGAALRALIFGGFAGALVPAAVLVPHCALYLPLPLQDPDSNPFYKGLQRSIQAFQRFMSSPVSGWGDSAE